MKIYYCNIGKHHWKHDNLGDKQIRCEITVDDWEKPRDCKDCKIQKMKDDGIWVKPDHERIEDLEKENAELKDFLLQKYEEDKALLLEEIQKIKLQIGM
jgi:hypothetical protein